MKGPKTGILITLVLFAFIIQSALGQNLQDRVEILKQTNVEALTSIALEANRKFERDLEKALEHGIPLKKIYWNLRVITGVMNWKPFTISS